MRALLSFTVLAALIVSACGSGHRPHLTPSTPRNLAFGCAGAFHVTATTSRGTTGLSDCAGLVGMTDTPAVNLKVGDKLLLSGLGSSTRVAASRPDLISRSGWTLTARHAGNALVRVSTSYCTFGRSTCPLMQVRVTG